MMIWRRGVVCRTSRPWDGVQELLVDLTEPVRGRDRVRALAYMDATGPGEIGDEVLLNVTALHRDLGTGGYAFVVVFPDRLPPDPPPGPGHIVKARYTPMQALRLGVEEEESQHHDVFRGAGGLDGMPVITADLHSALPAIITGLRASLPTARVAHVMTDGAALPLAFSRTVAALADAGWIGASITTGQAYGGDHEAVNIYTGLLAARHVARADVAIVVQGPGNLGTGTHLGFSGTAAAEALAAAHLLGGMPVGSLRISAADARSRHYGISHHSTTVYNELTLVPATIVVPILDDAPGEVVARQAQAFARRHTLVWQPVASYLQQLAQAPVEMVTMGRTLAEDPSPFLAAAAAGGFVGEHLRGG